MEDLIKRQTLLEEFRKCYTGHLGMEDSDALMTFKGICRVIEKCPSAQKTGHWTIAKVRGNASLVCSNCKIDSGTFYEYAYCPNCGAKMEAQE